MQGVTIVKNKCPVPCCRLMCSDPATAHTWLRPTQVAKGGEVMVPVG
jgi:hypothetical protein